VNFGSLFCGIGGFDLGFERAGLQCAWQVEKDPWCRSVLAKHWPDVPKFEDVRNFATTPDPALSVDVICGGFPCQDISFNNPHAEGITGERSSLWFEYARVVRTLRPAFVVVENVAALVVRGLRDVLRSLAECGFDAEWQTLSAQMLGAPHQRDRLFIVAYRPGQRFEADGFFAHRPHEADGAKQAARQGKWPGRLESGGSLPDRIRWCPDRELCRMVDGLPDQLDRYRGLGNAVVPQCAEWIGRRLIEVTAGSM
jgi:DNA (cytosine-5)-methyltransferase 1